MDQGMANKMADWKPKDKNNDSLLFTSSAVITTELLLGLPGGFFQNTGHWQCLWHKILSYLHM